MFPLKKLKIYRIYRFNIITIIIFSLLLSSCNHGIHKKVLYNNALIEMQKKRYDNAISLYTTIIEKDSKDYSAYLDRSKAIFLKLDVWHTKNNFEKHMNLVREGKEELSDAFLNNVWKMLEDGEKAFALDYEKSQIEMDNFYRNNPVLPIRLFFNQDKYIPLILDS